MKIIKTTPDLQEFCRDIREKDFVVVDTEFMREKTFWPILCLIQAAADGSEAIIDPLAKGIDLSPFLELLADKSITKVFHAARQDLEIFYRLMDEVPAPLFDSQIAAMACGFGDQIGYEPLMRTLVNAKIDKASRFTDWSRRPLTDAQLQYAIADVTHLRAAYPILLRILNDQKREHWVSEELNALYDTDLYYVKPEEAWRRLRLRNIRPGDLGPLVKLAEWREREAQSRDIPRSRILKDESLFELARMRPKSAKELSRARSIAKGYENSSAGSAILKTIGEGVKLKDSELPQLAPAPTKKAPADVVEMLKVLLKHKCERVGVAPKLIASVNDLEAIAIDDDADVPALTGWRRELFGEDALSLKRGKIALRIDNNVVSLVEL